MQQLGEFTPLRSDYEVDFWLRQLEFQPAAEQASVSKKAKNRRLAQVEMVFTILMGSFVHSSLLFNIKQMNRLLATDFFEDESSRRRAPLLHEQYIGQYEAPQAPKQHSKLSDRIIYNAQVPVPRHSLVPASFKGVSSNAKRRFCCSVTKLAEQSFTLL